MEKNNYKICYFSTFENELNEIIYYVSNVLKNKKASERLLKNIENEINSHLLSTSLSFECVILNGGFKIH